MNCLWLYGFLFFRFVLACASIQSSSEKDIDILPDERQILASSYLKDLEELGYCIIPQLFSLSETKLLYERVWHEFIEKAWPNCRMDDRSNWETTFPIHNRLGIFSGPAGQIQTMWDLRQDPRIVAIFAQIWNTEDLIVSMDGLSFMCPTEIREGYFDRWLHVDQAILVREDNAAHNNNPPIGFISESFLKTKPFTIQGQFLFEDSFEGDGGFYCIPKSHLKFPEFASQLETIEAMKGIGSKFLQHFFENNKDESGNPYCMKHITAPRGSLILWDSRTVHWNQFPNKDRLGSDLPKVRMVGYLCYVPRSRLTQQDRDLRRKAFEMGVSTGHNPASPELKFSKDHISKKFEHYLEDSSYTQPIIHLTSLGKALLGQ